MPEKNPAVLDFLLSRRSTPAKMLGLPVPSRAELDVILTAALRSPDHGKLEPWRLVVIEGAALPRLAAAAEAHGRAAGLDEDRIGKGVGQFANANLIVAVIAAPVAHEKVPEIEQVQSAAAVCLALVNAALASGYGANWLSGWVAHDTGFASPAFGLAPGESVAGLIHIGTPKAVAPERPRPDLAAKTTWISA